MGARRGPYATNPIGVARGLWLATWLLQALFFFAGGCVHSRSWERQGGGWPWVFGRLGSLVAPALSLVTVGIGV